MTTTLPNMLLVLPDVGADIGAWGTKLNTLFGLVDAHDHTGGKGPLIKTAAISIDADLSLQAHGLTSINRLVMRSVTALTSGATTIFVSIADNELYWRTAAGVNVKLTSGASINTTLVGGIVGDYSTVGAEVAYDDANDRYTFKQQATKPWAKIACGDVQLFETGTTESISVRLKCPAALAASFDITLPLAAPGSTSLVQMDSAGVLTASNTVANAVTLTSLVTLTGGFTTPANSALTGTATLTVAGLITASNGLTAAANKDVTVSGTGTFKHGTKSRILQLGIRSLYTVSAGSVTETGGTYGLGLANNSIVYFALPPMDLHERIVGIQVYFNSAADRTACTVKIYQTSAADPQTTVFTDTTQVVSGTTGTAIMQNTSLTLTATAAQSYWLQISNGVNTPKIQSIIVNYDIP
jgi:hypothetical protein